MGHPQRQAAILEPSAKLRNGHEAKPCPFCGSTELVLGQGGFSNREVAGVHCIGCGCDGPEVMIKQQFQRPPKSPENRKLWDQAVYDAEAACVALWNKAPRINLGGALDVIQGAYTEGFADGQRFATPKGEMVPVTKGRLEAERLWQENWGRHFAPPEKKGRVRWDGEFGGYRPWITTDEHGGQLGSKLWRCAGPVCSTPQGAVEILIRDHGVPLNKIVNEGLSRHDDSIRVR